MSLRPGESSPFSELLLPGCLFLSSPQSTGIGGGIASAFKSKFPCQQLSSVLFPSFKVQLLEILFSHLVLCTVVYRPLKRVKGFIQDFADLLGSLLLKYDVFFNIHICCESGPLEKDFLALIDSFNLTRWVRNPTHEKGRTLDLVFCITDITDCGISDHFPVMFKAVVCNKGLYSRRPVLHSRTINPSTCGRFCSAFTSSVLGDVKFCGKLHVGELANLFSSTCSGNLDSVAPLRTKATKSSPQPWLNETTRSLRHTCSTC